MTNQLHFREARTPRGNLDNILVETRTLKRTKQFRQAFLYHVTKTVRPFGDINGKQINILMPYIIELLYVNLGVLKTTLEQVSYI